MSNNGFVYMLTNPYMRAVKIGCTERSPHTRAEELSKSTGVPAPFVVSAYIEVPDFQAVEKHFHKWLEKWRVSEFREFFDDECEGYVLRLLYWHPKKFAFALCNSDYACSDEGVEFLGPDPFSVPKAQSVDAEPEKKLELVHDSEQPAKQTGGFE